MKLTDEQHNAVYTEHKKVLVLAGAGTGKTRVLTERVKHLLKTTKGNMVAITFTNLATNEMKARLRGTKGIKRCFIGTIHSFANKILHKMGMHFQILSNEAFIKLAGELIQKHCQHLNQTRFVEIQSIEERKKMGDEDASLGDFEDIELAEYRAICGTAHLKYIPTCVPDLAKKKGYIEFDQIIVLATKYFDENNIEIEHLLVDEFQDVGSLEFEFLNKLNSLNRFYVGDDWQSIYSFKGGNVGLIKSLNNDINYEKHHLTKNFRNPPQILKYGDVVLRQINSKIEKENVSMCGRDGSVVEGSRHEIYKHLKKGSVILSRSNKELYELEQMLGKHKFGFMRLQKSKYTNEQLEELFKDDRIKAMSVHQSKGLEFDDVIIYSKSLRMYPTYRKVKDEERKILYVAITRTKENLIILN